MDILHIEISLPTFFLKGYFHVATYSKRMQTKTEGLTS